MASKKPARPVKPAAAKKPSSSSVQKKPTADKARPAIPKPAAKAPPPKPSPAKATPPAKASPPAKAPAPAKATVPAKPAAPPKAPVAKVSPLPPSPKPTAAAEKPVPASKPESSADGGDKGRARDALRSKILGNRKPAKPIAFSLDEVRELAKAAAAKGVETPAKGKVATSKGKTDKVPARSPAPKPAVPNHVKAASLADILGFNPRKAAAPSAKTDADIPEKFRRYYRLLIELRNHVTGQLDQHTEDTLKRSSKEDAGDLSSYGQHMADAGTDTFDRDFALSLVSSEQEALSEIEAAIQRIKAGTYGTCEISQKPIAKERLLAVPFTRYSAEAQKEIERNRYRARTGAGLFGELGDEGASISGGSDDD
ncbi:MAG: transcriptional regulator [Verrucomicrobia bacterium]|nr:transcriptional regulator [Verrucomicrobiota bacterium]